MDGGHRMLEMTILIPLDGFDAIVLPPREILTPLVFSGDNMGSLSTIDLLFEPLQLRAVFLHSVAIFCQAERSLCPPITWTWNITPSAHPRED
jgi:hypothetical protein